MIAATQLTRRFDGRTVVEEVSFEVGRSEIVALLGPNGAGKTTTLRMLAGLIRPTSGSVAIAGVALTPTTGSALRRRIGFLTESPGLWDRLTVRENLSIYARLYQIDAESAVIGRMLELFELSDRATTRTAELSKGMRQKVALARALLHEPEILLLDEPTSGLDPEIALSVRRLLAERRALGCSIIVSTHNLDEAERIADRIAVLQRRLIAIDTAAALRRRLVRGRTMVRIAGGGDRWLAAVRAFDAGAAADGEMLRLQLANPERDTPVLVRTLAMAGAEIQEVRAELPALEDVYLHLVAEAPDVEGSRQ